MFVLLPVFVVAIRSITGQRKVCPVELGAGHTEDKNSNTNHYWRDTIRQEHSVIYHYYKAASLCLLLPLLSFRPLHKPSLFDVWRLWINLCVLNLGFRGDPTPIFWSEIKDECPIFPLIYLSTPDFKTQCPPSHGASDTFPHHPFLARRWSMRVTVLTSIDRQIRHRERQ